MAKYWKNWKMNQDTSVRFEFAKPWFLKGRVCGELSQKKGQGWFATLVGANTVSACVSVCVCAHTLLCLCVGACV